MNNFKNEYDGSYTIAFYFHVENKTVELLYSWILPINNSKDKWFKKEIGKEYFVLFGSFTGDKIKKLWFELLAGSTLIDSSKLIQTPLDNNVSEFVQNWVFNAGKYKYRPRCIFETKNEWMSDNKMFCSPSKSNISYVESFFCIDKQSFFNTAEKYKSITGFLRIETGIDFYKTQTGRLGNIEWYIFPSGNIDEISYINSNGTKIESEKGVSCKTITVKFTSDCTGCFLVNIRCTNGNAITCDIIKELEISTTNKTIDFEASEEVSSYNLIVWKKEGNSWHLWYEKHFSLIRSLHTQMNIVGNTGFVDSKNLNEIGKQSKLIKRVKEIQKVTLYSRSTESIVGNDGDDPWRLVIQETENKIRKYYPQKSNALFLPKGWDGQVQFYEWLKEQPSKVSGLKELIIVDPYLESEILRFIPRFSNTDIKYVLITNTKIVKDCEAKVQSIINEANHIFSKLKSFSVAIHDVIKNSQLIHDRYLLFKDADDLFVKGFHLSNSIQMANKNFPLLITEIPNDVLFDIQDWLAATIDSELELIWDSTAQSKSKETVLIDKEIKEYPNLDHLEILNSLNSALKKYKIAKWKRILISIFNFGKPSNTVFVIWKKICENAHNNNHTKDNLTKAAENFSPPLWEKICLHYEDYLQQNRITKFDDESLAILHCLNEKEFNRIIDFADDMLDYLHPSYNISAEAYYLIDLLAKYYPEKLLYMYKTICNNVNKKIELQSAIFLHQLFVSLGHLFLFDDNHEDFWINSEEYLLIGFAASSLNKKVIDNKMGIEDAATKISHLDFNIQLSILTKLIYELRIIDNRCNKDISKTLRDAIFKYIINSWPVNMTEEAIENVLLRCGGPGKGNWACSTTNELFIPLIGENKLSIETFCKVTEKLCKHHLEYNSHFSSDDSLNVFEIFGWATGQLSNNDFVEELKKIVESELRNISKPFAASISYKSYSDSLDKLHKALIILFCMNKYIDLSNSKIDYLINTITIQLQEKKQLFATPNMQLNQTVELYMNKNSITPTVVEEKSE